MNRAEHHDAAERLLEQARTEQDSIRRSQILAEAQVHATLAAGAAPETSLASRGQSEAWGRESAGAVPSAWTPGSDPFQQPAAPADKPQGPAPASPPPEPVWRPRLRRPQQQGPVPARPRTIRGNSAEEEPDPAEQEPDPAEQEPGGPEQEPGPARRPPSPGDPGEQEPGGFTPF